MKSDKLCLFVAQRTRDVEEGMSKSVDNAEEKRDSVPKTKYQE